MILIIEQKISQKKKLNKNKIFVKKGLMINEGNKFYKNYNFIRKNRFPYVVGKIACSSNYFILNNKTFITNEHSRKVSHILRYKNQGILTSYKTVNSDNPMLNCRLKGLEKFSPKKLIIDKDLKIKINSRIIKNSKYSETFIFHNSQNLKKINKLKLFGLRLIKFQVMSNGYFDLKELFAKIYKLEIHNILVECGSNLTNEILKSKLFNEFYLFKSNNKLINKRKISILKIKKNLKIFNNKIPVNTYLEKDNLIHYY